MRKPCAVCLGGALAGRFARGGGSGFQFADRRGTRSDWRSTGCVLRPRCGRRRGGRDGQDAGGVSGRWADAGTVVRARKPVVRIRPRGVVRIAQGGCDGRASRSDGGVGMGHRAASRQAIRRRAGELSVVFDSAADSASPYALQADCQLRLGRIDEAIEAWKQSEKSSTRAIEQMENPWCAVNRTPVPFSQRAELLGASWTGKTEMRRRVTGRRLPFSARLRNVEPHSQHLKHACARSARSIEAAGRGSAPPCDRLRLAECAGERRRRRSHKAVADAQADQRRSTQPAGTRPACARYPGGNPFFGSRRARGSAQTVQARCCYNARVRAAIATSGIWPWASARRIRKRRASWSREAWEATTT